MKPTDVAAYFARCTFQRGFTSSSMRAKHATSVKLVILKIAAQKKKKKKIAAQ